MGSRLAFFVGERQVALWLGEQTFMADWLIGEPPPLAALIEQAGVKPRPWPLQHRVQIWLSGALARPFVLEPIAGLAGREEALAAARARAAEETGWASANVELWIEKMPRAEPVLVVATRAESLAALRDAARKARLRVASVRPWWSAALAAAAGQGGAFDLLASADPEALVILGSREASWTDGSTLTPLPDAAQCEAVVQRRITARGPGACTSEALRSGGRSNIRAAAVGLHTRFVAQGGERAMKQAHVEFEAPAAPGIAPWIVAGLLFVVATMQSLQAYNENQQLQALRLAQAERAAALAALNRPKPPAMAAPYEASARRMLAERQAAWPAALLALERTVAGATTVTSLEYSAADDTFRVEGLAQEHAAAVALLEALNAGNSGLSEDELRWSLVRSAAISNGGEAGGGARLLIAARRPTLNPERGNR